MRWLEADRAGLAGLGGVAVATRESAPATPRTDWSRYALTSSDGALELAVDGRVVARGAVDGRRAGFIALLSDGSEIRYRNLRLTRRPGSTRPGPVEDRMRPIFDGQGFAGWQFPEAYRGLWVIDDGVIRYVGDLKRTPKLTGDLWSEREYGNFVLVADWRLPAAPKPRLLPTFTPEGLFRRSAVGKVERREILDAGDSGIYLRGNSRSQVNIWSQPMGSGDINDYHKDDTLPIETRRACVPRVHADRPFGRWNRFVITMDGDRVTVVLNGETVIDRAELPGVPPRGRIALQYHNDPIEFRNLFIMDLP